MIKNLRQLISKKPKSVDEFIKYPEGKRYYRENHQIGRSDLDEDAIKVIQRLAKFGYKAYLVGGSIRDLLLGRKPKDFDVVTNATPNQIKKIFSNSRIIGRRFRIVHIMFRGGKLIEVSTFRSFPMHRYAGKAARKEDLLQTRDNEFGTPKEDSARRDFTINALYFDPRNESIIDFTGGYEDLRNFKIRVIGDPEVSFKEDPVRMLRAVKFATLLDMQIGSSTTQAIRKNRQEIQKVNPARMLEEFNKIFRTQRTADIMNQLAQVGLFEAMFPIAGQSLKKAKAWPKSFLETDVGRRLQIADRLMHEHEELTANIYLGLIHCDPMKEFMEGDLKKGTRALDACRQKLDPILDTLELPRKDRERLVRVFANIRQFYRPAQSQTKIDAFKKRDFFYESFMLFKINAMANKNDEAIQQAFDWEVGLKVRPDANQSLFSRGGGRRKSRRGPKTSRSGSGRGEGVPGPGVTSQDKQEAGKNSGERQGAARVRRVKNNKPAPGKAKKAGRKKGRPRRAKS